VPHTLTCQDVADRLIDYVEGDLEPDDRAAFEVHMARCAECATFLASYLRATELARHAVLQAMPAAARDRLVEALRKNLSACDDDET